MRSPRHHSPEYQQRVPILPLEANSAVSTIEDKFTKEDLPWIMKLRSGVVKNRRATLTCRAPSFYEEDQSKWAKKFSKAVEE